MKLGAWRNSGVREAIPDDLRDYMDGLGKKDLGGSLRIMRDQVDRRGWDAAVGAMEAARRQARRGERGHSRGKGGGRLDLLRRARRPRRVRCGARGGVLGWR